MDHSELKTLIDELKSLPNETEWLELKCNWNKPEDIGKVISAISNSAVLHRKNRGFVIWGINDITHNIDGTNFNPSRTKKGNEELENWLAHNLHPNINLEFHDYWNENDKKVVLLIIQATVSIPVRFIDTEYIRIGSYTKKLRDFPEKERILWNLLSTHPFESGIAIS